MAETPDPGWNESIRAISSLLANGLLEQLAESRIMDQDKANTLITIRDVNLFSGEMLESNRDGIYRSLQQVGATDAQIQSIPLLKGYDPSSTKGYSGAETS